MECIRQVGVGNILRSLTGINKQDGGKHFVEGSMAFDKSIYLMQSQGVNNKSTSKLSQLNHVNQSHVSTYNQYQQIQHSINPQT